MQPKEQEQLLGFRLTDDAGQADHSHHHGEEIDRILSAVYDEVIKAKPRYLPKLLKLVRLYARIPEFRNLLSFYYALRNKPDKSLQVAEEIVRDFPDFLYGRINVAVNYLDQEEPEQVPEVLGEALELKQLYPNRKVFTYDEYVAFETTVCRYLWAMADFDGLKARLNTGEQVAPDAEEWGDFREMLSIVERSNGDYPDVAIDDLDSPDLHHPILAGLYVQGLEIEPDTLTYILQLPRETLIEDLLAILKYSAQELEHFEAIAWTLDETDNMFYFPFHALFLLAELKATEQFPAIMDILRQGNDYLEFWFGDHTFETLWLMVYHLGGDQLDLLAEYVRERTPESDFKPMIFLALKQIYLHQPERREEIFPWFRELLQFYVDNHEDELLADPDLVCSLISDAIVMDEAVDLLPLIQTCYELELADESDFGTYAELESEIRKKGYSEGAKRKVFTHTTELYRHLLDTWYAEPDLDDLDDLEDVETPLLDALEESWRNGSPSHLERLPATEKPAAAKAGRNDPCPCGSGKKYKKCCLRK